MPAMHDDSAPPPPAAADPAAGLVLSSGPQVQALVSYLEHEARPMIVLDTDYRILAANTAYRRQFGAVQRPYLGRPCYEVSHGYDVPCDQAGEHCPMARARETRGPDRVLHIHHTPRGPEHVDVELRPILDASREVVAYVERLCTVRSAAPRPSADGLVGRSPSFNAALAAVQRVAPSALPVLLLGESGTGKELFARAVHEACGADRAGGPFVVVDCSGLPETLFESELFGYEKGAFTGAQGRKKGLVETAQGGTLFLDEIGDVPLSMQVKLLRLIESGTYRRVGGVETLQADFRLVAATHKPLEQMVAQGLFRQDLYYRIAAFPIVLPPLRERREDIPMLVDSFLQRARGFKARIQVSPEALARLQAHSWPGNIRELRNVLERARLFADDGVIRTKDLPAGLGVPVAAAVTGGVATPGPQLPAAYPDPATAGPAADSARPPFGRPTRELDDSALRAWISQFSGTRREMASALGWSERTLYRRLKALAGG
ncbi:Fis family sigma54 specific transcriptional regulator [Roseateles asaccharophilus]|uniref:Fis family sigma54 specific transcriptional regulator n=1 Tax=Roseateles asaccharophilus TaxID=582607 RepID=A0A4R6N375_9BURK|nr:Fis family sigma54 specific transcriptional regulator [Roseateles asaccharophilus]